MSMKFEISTNCQKIGGRFKASFGVRVSRHPPIFLPMCGALPELIIQLY